MCMRVGRLLLRSGSLFEGEFCFGALRICWTEGIDVGERGGFGGWLGVGLRFLMWLGLVGSIRDRLHDPVLKPHAQSDKRS